MDKKYFFAIISIVVMVLLGIIFFKMSGDNIISAKTKEGKMKLTSVFENGDKIPSKYTCDGEGAAPELTITDVPKDALSLVLIVDDPDAPMGVFTHWLLYNIPVDTKNISAANVPTEAIAGMTDFGKTGYGGPCPPYGTHRYFFKLFAIDTILTLPHNVRKDALEKAIEGHVIEKAELIGLYARGGK